MSATSPPTPAAAAALCHPSSDEDTLRLFISLLGTKVTDGNDSIDETTNYPRLRALLSKGSPSMYDCPPRARIEASSDEDSVSSSHGSLPASLFPSLALFKPAGHQDAQDEIAGAKNSYDYKSTQNKGSSSSWPAETALHNLSLPISVRAEDIPSASSQMASRALDSLTFLVIANLRQFFKIQLRRHVNESGPESTSAASKAQEIASSFFSGIASGESNGSGQAMPIDVKGASTSFQVADDVTSDLRDATTRVLKASIVFNMVVDASIHGTDTSVPVKAPGTIEAIFAPGGKLIEQVKLTIETDKLLVSMRNQARALVLKAVACQDFPIICVAPEEQRSTTRTDAKSALGGKMQKLALCASLELASVIAEDQSSITNPKKTKRPAPSRKPLFRSNKRRLSVSHAPMKKANAPSSMLPTISSGQAA